MKQHLVAVTGMSPAVVTETLYGIQRDGMPWPDSLSILTTARGREAMGGALEAQIAALCADYGKPRPRVSVEVIPGGDGNPIDDARSLADHEALGDFIMRHVRNLTQDDDLAVHASIAGGRKTMTYYLGYAMSLFGRPQDRLSHVLVAQAYEGLSDFFYPTPGPRRLKSRDGTELDASEAEVILADIPFLRLRDNLPKNLLSDDADVRFRALIRLISLGNDESRRRALRLNLPANRPVLVIGEQEGRGPVQPLVEVPLKPVDYAFYRALVRPQVERDTLWERESGNYADADLCYEICMQWARLNGVQLDTQLATTEVLKKLADIEGPYRPDPRTLESFREKGGVVGDFFSRRINNIRQHLEAALPLSLSRWLELRMIADSEGNRFDFYDREFPVQQTKKGRYGIALRTEAIEFES